MDQAVRKSAHEHEGIAIDEKHEVEISMAQNLHLYSRTSSSKHGGLGLHPCLRAWITEISILVYEHGSEISILVYEHGE